MNKLKSIIITASIIACLASCLPAAAKLERIDQWKHKGIVLDTVHRCFADKDGQLILSYGKSQRALVSKEKFTPFAFFGQSPSELEFCYTSFPCEDDHIFVERPAKIKIFTKKGGEYVWKKTVWQKESVTLRPYNGISFDKKIFYTGFHSVKPGPEVGWNIFLVYVYDMEGNPLKKLIFKKYPEGSRLYQSIYHIIPYGKDRLFFIPSHEAKVSVISSKTLEVVKEVPLKTPPFYKKMPDDFYYRTDEEYNAQKYDFHIDLENWAKGYSRITKIAVDKKYLVIQVQTCSDKLKRFALLFYNAETFNLENTIFTNDLLLDIRDGKYYFSETGVRFYDDEDIEDCVINVCRLK